MRWGGGARRPRSWPPAQHLLASLDKVPCWAAPPPRPWDDPLQQRGSAWCSHSPVCGGFFPGTSQPRQGLGEKRVHTLLTRSGAGVTGGLPASSQDALSGPQLHRGCCDRCRGLPGCQPVSQGPLLLGRECWHEVASLGSEDTLRDPQGRVVLSQVLRVTPRAPPVARTCHSWRLTHPPAGPLLGGQQEGDRTQCLGQRLVEREPQAKA